MGDTADGWLKTTSVIGKQQLMVKKSAGGVIMWAVNRFDGFAGSIAA
jgi:hypothetical protein